MKTHLGSAALVGVTVAAVMGCYAVSMRVAAERAEVERVRVGIAADTREIRMLQAELRTRARLPELQRWNERVFALAPPKPGQFLGGPVVLASYTRAGGGTPAVRYAAAHPAPTPRSPVEQVAYLDLPHGAAVAPLAASAAAAPVVAIASAPLAATRPAPRRHAPVVPPSLALDATLGGQIDAAAAAEAGRKAAMR